MKGLAQSNAASVLARLKNEATQSGEPFNPLLARYVGFRLLYRLSVSNFSDNFLLKGATMFLFWTGVAHRTTRDLDFLSLSISALPELEEMFKSICQIPCPEDGVTFDPNGVRAELIREEQAYGGYRIRLLGQLGTARVPLQIDIGLGDAVTPGPMDVLIPGIISRVPDAKLRGYPAETAIAEKFHAMVMLGLANSRMKDFYDVAYLADTLTIQETELRLAIIATFTRRRTELPKTVPGALTTTFLESREISVRWQAFARKNRLMHPYDDLEAVQHKVRKLLLPCLDLTAVTNETED